MLPSERNERLLWRVSVLLLVLMVLFLVIWTVRFIGRRANRLLEQRNIPVDDGRAGVAALG